MGYRVSGRRSDFGYETAPSRRIDVAVNGSGISKENASEAADRGYEYRLGQNYPNPFNPTTTIEYEVKERGWVEIKLYDMIGREVMILSEGIKERGRYSIEVDGSGLKSGTYVYVIRVNGYVDSKKMMLLK